MAPRDIDHLVLAVRDLDAARETYRRLGFTLTPVARHPWGTANSLVQMHGVFLELLAVADAAAIPEPTHTAFSFGAFNRDYLKTREGLSMLALQSTDPAADRADFDAHHLPVYEPFRFERSARGPDGAERKVAFSLTFTGDARTHGQAGFFTGVFLGNPDYAELNSVIDRLAASYGVTPIGIATAWLTRHPAQMQVVLGTTTPGRVIEAAAGSDLPLTRAEWYELYRAAGYLVP